MLGCRAPEGSSTNFFGNSGGMASIPSVDEEELPDIPDEESGNELDDEDPGEDPDDERDDDDDGEDPDTSFSNQ